MTNMEYELLINKYMHFLYLHLILLYSLQMTHKTIFFLLKNKHKICYIF